MAVFGSYSLIWLIRLHHIISLSHEATDRMCQPPQIHFSTLNLHHQSIIMISFSPHSSLDRDAWIHMYSLDPFSTAPPHGWLLVLHWKWKWSFSDNHLGLLDMKPKPFFFFPVVKTTTTKSSEKYYKLKAVYIGSWNVECPITRGQDIPGREVKHCFCQQACMLHNLYQLTVLQCQDVKNKTNPNLTLTLFTHLPALAQCRQWLTCSNKSI